MGRLLTATAAGFCLALVLAQGAAALECPAPQPLSRPGVLRETPAQIAVLTAAFRTGDVRAKTVDIIAGLRAEHPSVEPAEIMNYLITAYCPVAANAPGLNDGQRQSEVDQFVLMARALLY